MNRQAEGIRSVEGSVSYDVTGLPCGPTTVMKERPLMCACKRYGPVHPWEPGEWCSPERVIPPEPESEDPPMSYPRNPRNPRGFQTDVAPNSPPVGAVLPPVNTGPPIDPLDTSAPALQKRIIQLEAALPEWRERVEELTAQVARVRPTLAAKLINLGKPDERFTLNEVEDALDAALSESEDSDADH